MNANGIVAIAAASLLYYILIRKTTRIDKFDSFVTTVYVFVFLYACSMLSGTSSVTLYSASSTY